MTADPQVSVLLPAMAAGILVLLTHVPLGRVVLLRGIIFIDLALAQVAGLGVVIADFLGWEPGGLSTQVSALTASLLAAAFLHWSERRMARNQEAIIGLLFVCAASAEIILLSFNPHGAEHMKDLLVGQIIWVSSEQLIWAALATVPILVLIRRGGLERCSFLFYGLFACAITISVQMVGVFLVFASLIIPALASRSQLGGYGLGLLGYGAGMAASLVVDLPTGAAIVCALTVTAAGKAVFQRVGSAS
ncbi:MAG: metal ABC transporter permease [Magnetospirillum sp.]|nr:metal ABC transporter permease [Magnetospirillum sp.]